jgi:uncharacterized 2Fe-2S/4Fe-4S cluster protein (DUF4445 family)
MGGVAGAIDHVSLSGGRLTYSTVEGAPARGICGSGLIDLIALLVHEGIIDETGAWDEESDSFLAEHLRDGRFYLTEDIYLSQGDIRQFQLAKAAVRTGIEVLTKEYGITTAEIDKVYIAGGFGYHLNIEKAVSIGLIPPELADRAVAVGNTSLAGAVKYLSDPNALHILQRIKNASEDIILANDGDFQEVYLKNTCLG